MRYLITGGAGFIGSNLSIKLLEDENNYVTILDDISTGSLENLVSLKGHERVEIHEGSILNSELLESLISKSDMIFHLAAAVGVQYINDNPLHTLNTNVKGTELVLETSAKYNCKIMISNRFPIILEKVTKRIKVMSCQTVSISDQKEKTQEKIPRKK